MKIAIIGAGQIGGTLTRRLTALGHHVTVANSRTPDTISELTAETGAHGALAADAARGAELVIVTIPTKNIPDLSKDLLADAAEEVVVIDTNNYYPRQRDGHIAEIEDGLPEASWVAEQLGHTVVKVFNNIYFQHLLDKGVAAGEPERIALPVAADDQQAKDVVLALVDQLGFDPVDAGSLGESWRQQPGTPVYGTDLDADGVRAALAQTSPERPAEFRAE
jgi:predicted dinucleotide-binding enzyme